MAETDVSICARVLILLGAEPIGSLKDETDTAKICANVYEGVKLKLMSSYGWRFLMVKKALTKDEQSPAGEWKNSFVLPGEAISLTHAIFSNAQNTIASRDFEIFGRRIYTDHEFIIADFVVDRNEGEWPAYFVELVVAAMCATIGYAVTDQQNVSTDWTARAFGSPSDMGMGGMMGEAMMIDAQADGNVGLVNDAFVNARFGGY